MIDDGFLVDLAARLVRAESPDPPGDETRVVGVLARALDAAGIPFEIDEFAPRRFNLVARLTGEGARPALVFSAHMDTLPVGEDDWSRPPFSGDVAGGRLHGRGACDMKSGLAALVAAMAALAQDDESLCGDLVLAATAGESANCIGARRLVETKALDGAGAILVAEPTSMRLVTCQPAALWLRVTARGRSGHASDDASARVNAIAVLAEALPGLLAPPACAPHPLLGGATVEVGRIGGGRAVNLTPDRCFADLDLRLPPGAEPDAVEAAVAARLDARFAVERIDLKPAIEIDPAHPFARLCGAELEALRGEAAKPVGARYFTDAAILGPALGAPVATIGPGRLGGSGEVDESVELADLRAAAELYRRIARAQLG